MPLGEPRFHFATIDTTMREAADCADSGAAEGLLVTADEQSRGRGRRGRPWASGPDGGLYFSLLLRPPVNPAASVPLTLACGLGVARGLGDACGVTCDIRWPNDVLLADKKVAGVLVETAVDRDRVRHVIVGVGLNVNQPSFEAELASVATSVRIETGCEFDREAVLYSVLRRLDEYYRMFLERGVPAIVGAFTRASTYVRGKSVVIEGVEEELCGVTAGLDPAGVLLLDTDAGRRVPVLAGSVRPWRQ